MEIRTIGGFCYGVAYAYNYVLKMQEQNKDKQVVLIGELVHNDDVLKRLQEKGIATVDSVHELISLSPDKQIIPVIRAHGATLEDEDFLKKNYPNYIDLTCLFIKNGPHQAALKLSKKGCKAVIFGKKEHPEVIGIVSRARNALVYESPDDVKASDFRKGEKIGVVAQTTSEIEKYSLLAEKLKKIGVKAEVIDTYCETTKKNQKAIREIRDWADIVIVCGGKKSSNTKKLAEICSRTVTTYIVENSRELKSDWFKNKPQKIGIAAGASTPPWVIDDVKKNIENYK
jgi:4-hydroxy-3-methylbut-2-enyl diphosphate reductase